MAVYSMILYDTNAVKYCSDFTSKMYIKVLQCSQFSFSFNPSFHSRQLLPDTTSKKIQSCRTSSQVQDHLIQGRAGNHIPTSRSRTINHTSFPYRHRSFNHQSLQSLESANRASTSSATSQTQAIHILAPLASGTTSISTNPPFSLCNAPRTEKRKFNH